MEIPVFGAPRAEEEEKGSTMIKHGILKDFLKGLEKGFGFWKRKRKSTKFAVCVGAQIISVSNLAKLEHIIMTLVLVLV